jgi:RNA polymerase sigma factor (sigma-70 family)
MGFLLNSILPKPNPVYMFVKFNLEQHAASERRELHSAELEDSTLWKRFKSGNDLAFSIIYKKYIQRLYNYGMHTCYDRDLVLDSLQELFGRLWDKRSQVADVEAVNFYLFKSFRRLLLNKLAQNRKDSLRFLNVEAPGFEMLSSFEDSIILEEASTQQLEHLKKAIASLTKRQREVIFLKFFNELSYQDVAAVMEMNVDSVYNLMTKAIDALRKTLKRAYLYMPVLLSQFLG